jgi:DNA-directed RNA polymerase specialized sigma24 family protein
VNKRADQEPRQSIFIDTAEGPRPIRQEKGERLNFLYNALQLARAQNATPEIIQAANDAVFTEVFHYCGVPGRKEANLRGWNLPGSDPTDMAGEMDYRPDGAAPARLDRLYGDDWRQIVTAKVFFQLDKFKGKSAFHTWVYRIVVNELMDIIRERIENRTIQLLDWKVYGTDAKGIPGGKPTTNVAEKRFVEELDHPMVESRPARTAAEAHAAAEAINKLYRQQSASDRRFLELKWDALRDGRELSNRSIAVFLDWNLKRVYNRTAKFRKTGLLPPKAPDLQKREYNRRARAKLLKSKKLGLSSEKRA